MASTTRTRDEGHGRVVGTPSEGDGVLSPRYRALTFGIVSVVLLIAFEATAVSTAMPVAARDLHGLGLYAFAFSGYFTTSLLAMVVSGQWCDRNGPLAPLATGIAGFGAGLVISGTAQAMVPFVLGRAVQGLGGGLVIVALYVVVGRAYPERLRPAVMAAFSASWVVPSIVGPLVSGTVTEQLGWRWVFLAIPVLVVLPLVVMLPALRRATRTPDASSPRRTEDRTPPPDPSSPDLSRPDPSSPDLSLPPVGEPATVSWPVRPPGDAPGRAGESAGSRGRTREPGPGGGTPLRRREQDLPGRGGGRGRQARMRPWSRDRGEGEGEGGGRTRERGPGLDGRRIWWAAGLATGAALLQYAGQDLRPLSVLPALLGAALLVPSALRLLPRGTFRAVRGMPTVVLMRGIAAGSFMAAESFVPLMLVTQRGLSPTLAGLSLSGGGLTWALGSYVQARPRMEPYRERMVQVGMVLTASAIATVPLALVHPVPPWIVAVAWCAGGAGMGLAISALSVLMLRLSPPAEAGTNSAALQVSDALSNVLVVAAAGTVFSALGGGSVGAAPVPGTAAAGHPAAFTAVFLPVAGIALAGAVVAARLRARPARPGES
jgi:predicted MFS family arabinose efflux permease